MASALEPLIGVLDEALDLRIEVGADGMARIVRLCAQQAPEPQARIAGEPSPDGTATRLPSARAAGELPPDAGSQTADAALPLLDVVLAEIGRAHV